MTNADFRKKYEDFYKAREQHEKEMQEEVIRVMEIMDDHGYPFCDHIDYDYAHQFVKVETQNYGEITSWIWAVPDRNKFKAVLKWFAENTKFYGITAFMKYDGEENVVRGKYRPIPTFYRADEIERDYDHYFSY